MLHGRGAAAVAPGRFGQPGKHVLDAHVPGHWQGEPGIECLGLGACAIQARAAFLFSCGLGRALFSGRLLDVGTGTGRIAELFADRAAHLTGLDKSPEMLRLARTRLQHLPAGHVTLVQGDFAQLPFPDARIDGGFDTVLFHQVLHYALAPQAVLAEAARVTAPGGRIVIVDFAPHEREELRTAHAHARLGFSDAQIAALLTGAGFDPAGDRALPGHELIVKIWTGVRRAAVTEFPRLVTA